MLVDEATVSIENIHVQMTRTTSLARAVERGSNETAVARLLAMLCILSVFIPAFIMAEPVRSLFVPLSLAVGFAMIASYVLSSTLVPVLSVWLLKHHGGQSTTTQRTRAYSNAPGDLQPRGRGPAFACRWVVVPVYLAVCLLTGLGLVGSQLGTELFPQVDSGQFVLRFRMPPGTNYELTRQAWVRCLQVIEDEVGAENVQISMGFAGQQAPNYGMNNMLLFMRGPDDGQMRRGTGGGQRHPALPTSASACGNALPEKLVPWFADRLQQEGLSAARCRRARRQDSFRLRAGRHRQRGHEFRLAGAHRDSSSPVPTCRRRGPTPRRVLAELQQDPGTARCANPADAWTIPRCPSPSTARKPG